MSIRCPQCGWEYDVTLFQFGRSVRCKCGEMVRAGSEPLWDGLKRLLREEEENRLRVLQRGVDRISSLIVASGYSRVDIEIEIEKTREKCRELFPDKTDLFELIYVSRFRRLWEQFRSETFPSEPF